MVKLFALAFCGVVQSAITPGFCTGKDVGNYAHDTEDCTTGFYYVCAVTNADDPQEVQCGTSGSDQLVFNPYPLGCNVPLTPPDGICDYPSNVDCGVVPADCVTDTTLADGDTPVTPAPIVTLAGMDPTALTCASDGIKAWPEYCEEGYFYQCTHGTAYIKQCSAGLVYDPSVGVCNHVPADGTLCKTDTMGVDAMPAAYNDKYCEDQADGNHVFAEACGDGYYYVCASRYTFLMSCFGSLQFDTATGACNYAANVADCTAEAAEADPSDPVDPSAADEIVSCDNDDTSATFGTCVTTNWCDGKVSGLYVPDVVEDCEGGKYYMCNWGIYEALQCAAGSRWYVPSATAEDDLSWATQWYGYCGPASYVDCAAAAAPTAAP